MSHKINVTGTFFHRATSLYPSIPVELNLSGGFTVGASGSAADGSPNLAIKLETTLASAATQDIDLYSLVDALNQSVTAAELHTLIIVCLSPTGSGTVTKHATDGFTGFGSSYSLPVTGKCPLVLGSGGGLAVSNSNKVITLTNTSGVSATFNAYILARK
jgi:hypothetical protein